MVGHGGKWVRQFIWGQFGLTPPPEIDNSPAAQMARDFIAQREEREISEVVIALFHAFLDRKIPPPFLPTVKAAILAKHPWLVLYCTGCGTLIDVDMRVKKRDPHATIAMVIRDVHCERCRGETWLQIYELKRTFTSVAEAEAWERRNRDKSDP